MLSRFCQGQLTGEKKKKRVLFTSASSMLSPRVFTCGWRKKENRYDLRSPPSFCSSWSFPFQKTFQVRCLVAYSSTCHVVLTEKNRSVQDYGFFPERNCSFFAKLPRAVHQVAISSIPHDLQSLKSITKRHEKLLPKSKNSFFSFSKTDFESNYWKESYRFRHQSRLFVCKRNTYNKRYFTFTR